MPLSLANKHLTLAIDPPSARWTLHPADAETPFLEGARLGARLRVDGRPVIWEGKMPKARASQASAGSPHGPLETLRLEFSSRVQGLDFALEAALPRDYPFALLRLLIRNQGRALMHADHVDLALAGPAYPGDGAGRENAALEYVRGLMRAPESEAAPDGALRLHDTPGDLTFFVNGWQSWSFSGTLRAGERQFRTRLGPVQRPLTINPGTPKPRGAGRFASDMFGVLADRTHGRALVAGFVSQAKQFGSVDVACDRLAPSLRVRAQCDGVPIAPGGELATEWAYFQFAPSDDHDPLRVYAEAVAREHDVNLSANIPAGWCSWYQYYKSISESHMLGNLAALRDLRERLPLSVAQLDDGFQWAIGDWFDTNAKFAHGLGWLSKEIALAGFTPGLWLAPFILERGALLLREEPEWLLRNRLGRPVSAGWHWEKPSYALDMTHPGAQEHVQSLIESAVHEWGYPYLKLDFLYAAALPGRRRDPALTRAQTLRRALKMIRAAAGDDTFLLGCGCPLGAGVGIFDAMRIGPDVDPRWTPAYRSTTRFVAPEPGLPAARNAIRNALARLPLHGRWWLNDPDCLLARDTTGLTLDETLSLASVIALCGGMLFLSDDMDRLSPERRAIAEPLLPAVGHAAYALDWLDRSMPELLVLPLSGPAGEWKVVGLFNWGDGPADRVLDLAVLGLEASRPYHVCDFWNRSRLRVSDGRLTFPRVPAHGVRLLAIRPVADGPQFVGSTLHFSQGAEVKELRIANSELRMVIELGRAAEGAIWLALPGEPATAEVYGARTAAEPESDGVWRVEVKVRGQAEVEVRWREEGTRETREGRARTSYPGI